MGVITLPWSMEQDRENQIKANSVHVDDNFNTLLNATNGKLEADGSIVPTADLPMGSHKITGLATPTLNGDAATKGYVDSADTALSATCVKLSGAQTINDVKTFSSSPIVPTPTTNMQASTKKYVDDGLAGCVKLSGSQTIAGTKTFSSTISGNIDGSSASCTGNAATVTNGVYTTGAQTIAGIKTFISSPVVPAPTNSTDASTKKYVDDSITTLSSACVKLTGNQTIAGTKTFSSTISGNINGSSASCTGNAATVTNGVYTTGNQTIDGTKTFSGTIVASNKITGSISGNCDGNAGTVTNGVYTTGNQTIGGTKTFSSAAYGTASDADNSIVTTVSKNKGQNGYFKLGNGLIIQWGVVTETGATREVVFPVDFTTTNYSVCINPTNSNSDQVYTINVNNKTNSGFTSFCGGNVSLWPFNWIAIGY